MLPSNHCSSNWQVAFMAGALLLASPFARCVTDVTTGINPVGEISIEQLERKLERAKGKSELTRDDHLALIRYYENALDNLEAYQVHHRRYENLDRQTREIAEQSKRLQQQLAEANDDKPRTGEGSLDITTAPPDQLTRALRRVNAEEINALTELVQLRKELPERRQRLIEAREKLTTTVNRINRRSPTARSGDDQDTPPLLIEARRIEQQTAKQAQTARAKLLTLELASHNPRLKVLKQRIWLKQRTSQQLQQRSSEIERILSQQRQELARKLHQDAVQRRAHFADSHKLLRGASAENASTSQLLRPLAKAIDVSETRAHKLYRQIDDLQKKYIATRQKVETSGSSKALNRLVETQRRALPDPDDIRTELSAQQQLASDLMLEMFVYEDQIDSLADLQGMAQQLTERSETAALTGALQPDSSELDDLAELLRARYTLFDTLLSWSGYYLIQVQQNIHFLGLLERNLDDFEYYLRERQLWTRSIADATRGPALYQEDAHLRMDLVQEYPAIQGSLTRIAPWKSVLVASFIIAVLIRLRYRALIGRIGKLCRRVANPQKDRFLHTSKTLLATLLLALPLPLIAAGAALQLSLSVEPTQLTLALQQGLWALAGNGYFLLFLYHACRPRGLAECHFGWEAGAVTAVQRGCLVLLCLQLPLSWFNQTLISYYAVESDYLFLRVTLTLSMLLFSGVFLYTLRNRGAVLQGLRSTGHQVAAMRLRWLALLLLIALPAAFGILTTLGYVHSAIILGVQTKNSIWLLISVAVFHELCKRWLTVAESRHAQAATHSPTGTAGKPTAKKPLYSYRDRIIAVGMLGEEGMRIINALSFLLATAGLLFVWSEALPALGYLQEIELWQYSIVGDDSILIHSVSMADLGIALLAVVCTLLLYRYALPILDQILDRVFGHTTGSRYTVTTLTGYALLCAGFWYALVRLGFEWARFQWLVAALGVGIGFGLREIVANFVSGVIIMLERPIRVGDLVTIGNVEGTVSRIRIRATNVTTLDHQELVVPNKDFITGSLLNWSLTDPTTRLHIDIRIAYGTDPRQVMALVEQVARADEKVVAYPEPFVSCERFGEDAMELRLRFFMDDMDARLDTRSRLICGIDQALADAGIAIALPRQDVRLTADHRLPVELVTEPANQP